MGEATRDRRRDAEAASPGRGGGARSVHRWQRSRGALGFVALPAVLLATLVPVPSLAVTPSGFDTVVAAIEAEPYQAAYVPVGLDAAFTTPTPNDLPVEDYTSGSIPGSPDAPAWPSTFQTMTLHSFDGAPLISHLALHGGSRPGVVVVHGFNTNGAQSVIRWAAMLYADGYDVLAADQRDFKAESTAGEGYPAWQQTLGWKEAQDVLAAGTAMRSEPGVTSLGMVGFSEGAQNAVLAAGQDGAHVFDAVMTFSGPADQDTQIFSTAQPPGCTPPQCQYPVTDALVNLVVPPYNYTDVCTVLHDAALHYHTTPHAILANESAMHAQRAVGVPLLSFYAADDPLVTAPLNATLMGAEEAGHPLQRTVEIAHGAHAYFFDRWWQQRAILLYLKAMLPAASTSTQPTVNQTPGGAALASQVVAVPAATPQQADAMLARDVCDGSAPPGLPVSSGPTPTPAPTAAPTATPGPAATPTPTPTPGPGLANTAPAAPAPAATAVAGLALVALGGGVARRRRRSASRWRTMAPR